MAGMWRLGLSALLQLLTVTDPQYLCLFLQPGSQQKIWDALKVLQTFELPRKPVCGQKASVS